LRRRTTEIFIGIVSNVHRVLIESRAFKRPGSDLLSHALRHSTIGAEGLNGRVRNGIGCIPLAITTRPFKRTNPDRGTHCKSSDCRGKFADRQIKFASLRISFCSRRLSPNKLALSAAREDLSRASLHESHISHFRSSMPTRRQVLETHRCAQGASNKPIERLVPVSSDPYGSCTPGLSTWWSTTALKGYLVLREASRLDAFSGYPVRT
jgi:hypothetical protein